MDAVSGIFSLPFKKTDHYRTTVRFLQNPESAIEDILGSSNSGSECQDP